MNPLQDLDTKKFIISDSIYRRSKELLIKLANGDTMLPQLHVRKNYVSFLWPACTLDVYENKITVNNIEYNSQVNTTTIATIINEVVPYKRSMPISIPE